MNAKDRRIARLRSEVDRFEALMHVNFGTPLFATYLAQRGEAMRELRQMGVAVR